MTVANPNDSKDQPCLKSYKQALKNYNKALEIYKSERVRELNTNSSFIGEAVALSRIASVYRRQSEDAMRIIHDPPPPPPPDPSPVNIIKALEEYQKQLNIQIRADLPDSNYLRKADKLLELGDTHLMLARFNSK
jgi:tetratricopeptide (TPR) repeat protein